MQVNDSRFRFSHGKAPRGSGLWLFETRDREVVVQHNGPFSEAKRAALRHMAKSQAAGRSVAELFVCP